MSINPLPTPSNAGSKPLLDHLDHICELLSSSPLTDPINACPPSTRAVLKIYPASLIKLAYTKIHSYPFSEVPVCWRRLFTDASIYEAIKIVRAELRTTQIKRVERCDGENRGVKRKWWSTENEGSKKSPDHHEGEREGEGEQGDWIQKVVRLLDMAVIMAGAPQREETIEAFLSALQEHIHSLQKGGLVPGFPWKKGHSNDDAFSADVTEPPCIKHPILTCSNLSMTAFEKESARARPLVIQNALEHWPALRERSWKSPQYLMEQTLGGRRLVPVEVGRSYTDEGWGQKIVTFAEFMNMYLVRDWRNEGEEPGIGYLAQYDLFSQIPSLRADISIPDFCYTNPPSLAPGTALASMHPQPKLNEPLLNAWFGPAGTVSPLHTDPYHNILCQVVGKKYVRLYNPHETERLYPRGVEGGGVDMSNTSEVDVEADSDKQKNMFPLFKEAEYVETILSEGECLYIPVGWWHYVRSLTVSFSVSFWWN